MSCEKVKKEVGDEKKEDKKEEKNEEKKEEKKEDTKKMEAPAPKKEQDIKSKKEKRAAGAVHNQKNNEHMLIEGSNILGRFEVKGIIGGGGFAQIFQAYDKVRKEDCAIKVEHSSQDIRRMKLEICVLLALRGSTGIPEILGQGKWQNGDIKSHFIVMQIVGKNLSDVRRSLPHKKISERTLYRAMLQILKALSLLHGTGFLHRDLKPSNCCVGAVDCSRIYLIDYGKRAHVGRVSRSAPLIAQSFLKGLSRQYLEYGGIVRKPRAGVGLRGTIRYMSLDAHARHDLGPNNDLVAFLYTTIECGDGSLPWSYEKTQDDIMKLKQTHTGEKLCAKQPKMTKAAEYIESLNYHNIPDYEKLTALIEECNPTDLKPSEPYEWQYRPLHSAATDAAGMRDNATDRPTLATDV
uniref:non-specific serine/threonine protein kinase n=1 Tax=Caenorhabditis japonica TaxID=281687 RepID=A0A8R1HMQ9_CAEJA